MGERKSTSARKVIRFFTPRKFGWPWGCLSCARTSARISDANTLGRTMSSLVLGCMALGYMALPLRSPLPALTARAGRVVQQAMDPEILAEGQRTRAVQAKEAEKRAKLAQAAHAQNTVLAVQLESGLDTVDVDLALTLNADEAAINAEADFMFRSVDVNGDGEIAAYLTRH